MIINDYDKYEILYNCINISINRKLQNINVHKYFCNEMQEITIKFSEYKLSDRFLCVYLVRSIFTYYFIRF